jgi:hypothetical protein
MDSTVCRNRGGEIVEQFWVFSGRWPVVGGHWAGGLSWLMNQVLRGFGHFVMFKVVDCCNGDYDR